MGLSRRRFTKEFKMSAVQRLEIGASLTEVARALEVNPSVLHRWRREFHQGPAMPFRDRASGAGKRSGWPSWSAGLVSRRWRSIS
jgi:transposase